MLLTVEEQRVLTEPWRSPPHSLTLLPLFVGVLEQVIAFSGFCLANTALELVLVCHALDGMSIVLWCFPCGQR